MDLDNAIGHLNSHLLALCDFHNVPADKQPSLKVMFSKRKKRGWIAFFQPGTNTIIINRDFILKASWDAIYLVLKHEFAHSLQKLQGSLKGRYSEAVAFSFAKRPLFTVMKKYRSYEQKKLDV